MRRIILLVATTLFLAPAAGATDGVLEINQACAVHTGCFSGDDPDWPVEITASGSYLLTSNLVVPDGTTSGIIATASDVSIDLNGFAIMGPVTCSGHPVTCSHPISPDPAGDGILAIGGRATVKNGSIRGMGRHGLILGYGSSTAINVKVSENTFFGIHSYGGSAISGNSVSYNGIGGIYSEGSSEVVSGNNAGFNGPGGGIRAETSALVSGNNVSWNDGPGISAGTGSTVSGNNASFNDGPGISAGAGSTVSGNNAYLNGGPGISAGAGSTVSGNTSRGNTGYGLSFLGTASAYSENVISDNEAGAVTGTAVQLGQNACDGDTTCP